MNKALLAAFLMSPALALAASSKSYIVEFHEHAVNSAPPPKIEPRTMLDPARWGDVKPGVLSRVQEMEAKALRRCRPFRTKFPYSHVFKGFAAELSDEQVKILRIDPLIRSISADRDISSDAPQVAWGLEKTWAVLSSARASLNSDSAGRVDVYVIDTGIASHPYLTIDTFVNFAEDRQDTDCNGHGTHVAGTIGARNGPVGVVGMAPGIRLHAVKVLGCNGKGLASSVLKGIDWVTGNARKPTVVNMSLGGGSEQILDGAVERSVGTGIFYALAAGNKAADACAASPARIGRRVKGAMTVAATDPTDAEVSFSNFGECVEIWAPGAAILSTWLGERLTLLSGTSMAAAHVAGAAALHLSRYPASAPSVVEEAINQATVSPGTLSKDGRPISRLEVIGF